MFVLQALKKKYKKRTEVELTALIRDLEQGAPSEILKKIKESQKFLIKDTHLSYSDLLNYYFPTKTTQYDYPTWMTCLASLSEYASILDKIPSIRADLHNCFQETVRDRVGIFVLPNVNAAWSSGILVFHSLRINNVAHTMPVLLQRSSSHQNIPPNLNFEGVPYLQEIEGFRDNRIIQRTSELALFSPRNENHWIPEFNTLMAAKIMGGKIWV